MLILRPLLFIIYTNDLSQNVVADNVYLFADDTTFLCKGINTYEVLEKSVKFPEKVRKEFTKNCLQLNQNKTQKQSTKTWQ